VVNIYVIKNKRFLIKNINIFYVIKGKRLKYAIELLEKAHLCHPLKVWLIYAIAVKEKAHPCHFF